MSNTTNVSQLNDLRSYSRHWLGEFIDLYEAEQCLWQPKHPDYSNHNERNKAYDKLVEKLKEVEPNPDRAMVVRKINSLRSAFRREFRKTATKANYETRLWYYEKLLFIADQKAKRPSNGANDAKPPKRTLTFEEEDSMEFGSDDHQMDSSAAQTDALEVSPTCMTALVKNENQAHHQTEQEHHLHHTHHQQQHQQQQQQHQQHQHHHHDQQQNTSAQSQQPTQHTTAVKVLEITSLDSNSQREIQQAVNSLEHQHQMQQQLQQTGTTSAQLTQLHSQVPTIQIAREHLQPLFGASTYSTTATTQRQDDEYDAIGINVASKLRGMNPTQRIIAEKLISDVLFNGQLDNLSINSGLTQ